MSNRQLGWDDMRVRDRLDPRELAEADKAKMEEQEAQVEQQPDDEGWIPPGNNDQGSRKK